MSVSSLTYSNLQVFPYELKHLSELNITKAVNEHARLRFTGIVSEELKDRYVEMTASQTQVQISQIDEQSAEVPLFHGIVTRIEVKAIRDVYHIEVEAASHTYNLDIRLRSRSFQNKGMSYSSLFSEIASENTGMDIIDSSSKGAALGKFTMQYLETDWQFLKRMASRFQAGLIPATSFDAPKCYIGVPDGGTRAKLDDFHYSVRKNLSRFRDSSMNGNDNVEEDDFTYYEVETDRILDLGHQVEFRGKTLFVFEAHTQMKDSLLKHRYLLCPKNGMSQKPIYNEMIVGASVQGKVIAVSKDTVKVHLDIDPEQNAGEAHWFPYSSVYTAEGSSGWYCMPEINDYVRVYFPSHQEEEGVASSSVRKNTEEGETNKLGNPDIKYFRTASGKELMFGPEEIVITGKDGEIFIRLSESDGIQIFSKKNVKIYSDEEIMMASRKNVLITADSEIKLSCKQSSITLDGNARIIGQELKTN
jgi:hypothetical protein